MKIIKLLSILITMSSLAFGFTSLKHNNVKEIEAATTNVNFGQFYDYLLDKEEHYPYSDAYIKEYQQESGGYIDLWKSLGHKVDKANCEPNQHWHFFESWCKPSIDDGSFKFSAVGSRGYSYFSCPELQLWIIEASGVSSSKVEQAYNAAVDGKKAGTKVSTICANIRSIVPWSDINSLVLANLPANPNYHVSPAVDTDKTPKFTMSKFDYDGYQPGTKISFSIALNDTSKEIDSVTGTNVSISLKEGIYSFYMPSNHVDLSVTLKDKGGGGTPVVTGDGYKLVTSLNELIDGSQVIIGTSGTFKRQLAISTTQNANNRSAINMTYDNGYYKVSSEQTESVELCIFTISSIKYESKTYYQFYDSANKGYLYVCSNSSNWLRTQSTNNINGYFELTNNAGVMNIVASASSYSRNTLGNYSKTFYGCAGGTTSTTVDLAIYSDVNATTKVWANSYLKMDDPSFEGQGTGLCKTDGLYAKAKSTLISMGVAYITALTTSNDIDLSNACARYEAWANANQDSDPYDGLVNYNSSLAISNIFTNSENNIFIFVIVFISISSLTLLYISLKINKRIK